MFSCRGAGVFLWLLRNDLEGRLVAELMLDIKVPLLRVGIAWHGNVPPGEPSSSWSSDGVIAYGQSKSRWEWVLSVADG
jgi:hypothetical protein